MMKKNGTSPNATRSLDHESARTDMTLRLAKETIRNLTDGNLKTVMGGTICPAPVTYSCHFTCQTTLDPK